MRIDLDAAVWQRFYGGYGSHSAPEMLSRLRSDWSDEVADDLIWTDLFHQETLYPLTYASLPWLLHMMEGRRAAQSATLPKISSIVRCALYPQGNRLPSGVVPEFQGLSLNLEDHHQEWLTAVPTEEDIEVLRALGDWFRGALPGISDLCLAALSGAKQEDARYLLEAPLAVRGCFNASSATSMYCDKHEWDDIWRWWQPKSGREVYGSLEVSHLIQASQPDLADFLVEWCQRSAFQAEMTEALSRLDDRQLTLL